METVSIFGQQKKAWYESPSEINAAAIVWKIQFRHLMNEISCLELYEFCSKPLY